MGSPFAIRSQRTLLGTEGEPRPATLVITDGKIERILSYSEDVRGIPCIEGGEDVLMPGIFDTHAHINEPGRTDWEGFQTATRAAAAGGMTTVIDMPLNSIPATTSLEALGIKAKTASGKCSIDYGFWGGVVPGNSLELQPMVEAGALGFKCFLIESGVDEFPMSKEADLLEAMPILARLGVPLLVHAEVDSGKSQKTKSSNKYRDYLKSRPREWEVRAIQMMIRLAKKTGCKVHIVHLSASDALKDIARARTQGVPITVETCPHYLFFESEKIEEGATQFKCAPPIREHENREALWEGLDAGTIDFIVSDHSPCVPALKELQSGDFTKAWGGISGLQFSLSVVWTEMRRRRLSLRQLSRWMSLRTAEFAGMGHRKGQLTAGYDADLVLWDPEGSFRVEQSMIFHRNHLTPYEGLELFGKVARTAVRGEFVYEMGAFPRTGPTGVGLKRISR